MDKKTFIAHGLHMMGIYAYPEIIDPVFRIFENKANRDDVDYIGRVTKPVKRKFAKLYDEYQETFVVGEAQGNE